MPDQVTGETQIATTYLKALVSTMAQWVLAAQAQTTQASLQTTAIKAVFPAITSTSTSATAGTNADVPAQVAGYINITLPNGTAVKVPFYNP